VFICRCLLLLRRLSAFYQNLLNKPLLRKNLYVYVTLNKKKNFNSYYLTNILIVLSTNRRRTSGRRWCPAIYQWTTEQEKPPRPRKSPCLINVRKIFLRNFSFTFQCSILSRLSHCKKASFTSNVHLKS
jgi:hypothetical protein